MESEPAASLRSPLRPGGEPACLDAKRGWQGWTVLVQCGIICILVVPLATRFCSISRQSSRVMTQTQELLENSKWPDLPYLHGTNLGGWLVLETWLFPNIPFAHNDEGDVADERTYIMNMVEHVGPELAVESMHNHWDRFFTQKDVETLAAFGINALRIPIGYWIFEGPVVEPKGFGTNSKLYGRSVPKEFGGRCVDGCASDVDELGYCRTVGSMRSRGFTRDGFVSGGILFLERMLRWMKKYGMIAIIDIHSFPGGESQNIFYRGDSYRHPWMFCGTVDECSGHSYLEWGLRVIDALTDWIISVEGSTDMSGVIRVVQTLNEPLLFSLGCPFRPGEETGQSQQLACCPTGEWQTCSSSTDSACKDVGTLATHWAVAAHRSIRRRLPSVEIMMNIMNMGYVPTPEQSAQILESSRTYKSGFWYDQHSYFCYDGNCSLSPPSVRCNSRCRPVWECHACCGTAPTYGPSVFGTQPSQVIGEWTLADCDNGAVPPEILLKAFARSSKSSGTPGFLDFRFIRQFFANQKSAAWFGGQMRGDFFWTAKVGLNWDPTVYPEGFFAGEPVLNADQVTFRPPGVTWRHFNRLATFKGATQAVPLSWEKKNHAGAWQPDLNFSFQILAISGLCGYCNTSALGDLYLIQWNLLKLIELRMVPSLDQLESYASKAGGLACVFPDGSGLTSATCPCMGENASCCNVDAVDTYDDYCCTNKLDACCSSASKTEPP